MKSLTLDCDGPVHVVDHGGTGRPLVLVHGLGGSHLNWGAVATELSARFHVLAIDLIGFGHTPPAGRAATVEANRQLLGRFLKDHVGGRAVVAGNSMGGLISLLQASAEPDTVEGLVLVNAAIRRNLLGKIDRDVLALFGISMIPWVAERLFADRAAKATPEQVVDGLMRLCCADPKALSAELLSAHVEFAKRRHERPWADETFLAASRSLLRLLLLRRSVVDAAIKAVKAPALMIAGAHDRLVPQASLDSVAKLRPDWTYVKLDHCGHVPQMEDPKGFVRLVTDWADRSVVAKAA
jgi:pimeloyl-ACP methyl ester carboxylesterase